jgi:hypothetical protein
VSIRTGSSPELVKAVLNSLHAMIVILKTMIILDVETFLSLRNSFLRGYSAS